MANIVVIMFLMVFALAIGTTSAFLLIAGAQPSNPEGAWRESTYQPMAILTARAARKTAAAAPAHDVRVAA